MRDPDLSNKQKFVLSKIAEEAFTVAARHFATDDLPQKDWRHREAILAVGCQISEARNSQYNALKRHFENLAGRAGQAFATAMKEPTELQRQLRHQIGQALSTAGYFCFSMSGITFWVGSASQAFSTASSRFWMFSQIA